MFHSFASDFFRENCKDSGVDGCKKEGIKERRDAGGMPGLGCRTGEIQERWDQCCGDGPFLTGSGSEYFFHRLRLRLQLL